MSSVCPEEKGCAWGFNILDLEENALGVRRVQGLEYPPKDLHTHNVDFIALFIKTKG